jgi:dTDP-4-dehydrorhamnose 3,5-epimerase
MIFHQTEISGVVLIKPEPVLDERGFFSRLTCMREFADHGLATNFVQTSVSSNITSGTLRGMHFQLPPHSETKLVSCTRGAIFDVIVDIRPNSDTYGKWFGTEITTTNKHILYIPENIAHGFITLEDNTETYYQMNEYYAPGHARGIRWNDEAVGIDWPMKPVVVSGKDKNLPSIAELAATTEGSI